jgi:hypothetical protein
MLRNGGKAGTTKIFLGAMVMEKGQCTRTAVQVELQSCSFRAKQLFSESYVATLVAESFQLA